MLVFLRHACQIAPVLRIPVLDQLVVMDAEEQFLEQRVAQRAVIGGKSLRNHRNKKEVFKNSSEEGLFFCVQS
jgi:hypothetical protein